MEISSDIVNRITDLRATGHTPKNIARATGQKLKIVSAVIKSIAIERKKVELSEKNNCFLCGNGDKLSLTKTSCCDEWICDDNHTYEPFSFEKNSCFRNHDRNTLCGYHSHTSHEGNWWECKKCKDDFDPPEYHSFGTNEYNSRKLNQAPKVAVQCHHCGFKANSLSDFSYRTSLGYYCDNCADKAMSDLC